MVINETLVVDVLILISLIFYTNLTNIMVLLYIAGAYLILLGILLFLNDADIYTGFLWVIDLGVGLVLFIFILHFTLFLYQKSTINLSLRYYIFSYFVLINSLIFIYYFTFPTDNTYHNDLNKL